MKTIALVFSFVLIIFKVAAFGQDQQPAAAPKGPHQLTCGGQGTIGDAVGLFSPGDTLFVSGACNENVVITEEIEDVTLDGQGKATINSPDANNATINIRGNGITIRNVVSISGGSAGILVTRGETATIDGNVIQKTGTNGIVVNQSSSARIINTTVRDTPTTGIVITENSSARIGFLMTDDTQASTNVIQNNGENGIIVSGSSSARIVGNTISDNASHGVLVNRVSHADEASNTIDGNGGDGVLVARNSGVNLGEDTGTGIFGSPNSTSNNNTGFGIRCLINSYVDGRLGSLNGNSGPTDFVAGCINSLP
jgi:parallel beta-helix repeat protein